MSNKYNVAERFMRYVQIDTTSDPTSSTFPSTAKQRDLALILFEELKKLGLQEVEIDDWSYVFATISLPTCERFSAFDGNDWVSFKGYPQKFTPPSTTP